MRRDARCPNCGGPEYISTGIMGGGGPLGRMFQCGFRDSEDGIAPPTIPAMCRYTRDLLDKATTLNNSVQPSWDAHPDNYTDLHVWEPAHRLDDFKAGIGHWECRDCSAYLTAPMYACGNLFNPSIDIQPRS